MTETMIGHQSLAHVAELAALLRAHWNDRERVPLSSQLLEIAQVLDEVPKITAENERLKQEVEHYNKSGIVEIAVRNVSVADYMEHWEGRAEKAEAENERLREALKPFADCAETIDPDVPDSKDTHCWTFQAGDFRRARAALEKS